MKQNTIMANIYKRKSYKRNNDKTIIVLLTTVLIIVIFLIGSLAFYSTSNDIRGTITLREIDFCMNNNVNQNQTIMPASTIPCNVYVINSRNVSGTNTRNLADFLLRFSIKYELNNEVYENNENLISAETDITSNWTEYDGYYYYNHIVEVGQNISICDTLSFSSAISNEFQNCDLGIVFEVDVVQAQNDAYVELWDDAPDIWKSIIESEVN